MLILLPIIALLQTVLLAQKTIQQQRAISNYCKVFGPESCDILKGAFNDYIDDPRIIPAVPLPTSFNNEHLKLNITTFLIDPILGDLFPWPILQHHSLNEASWVELESFIEWHKLTGSTFKKTYFIRILSRLYMIYQSPPAAIIKQMLGIRVYQSIYEEDDKVCLITRLVTLEKETKDRVTFSIALWLLFLKMNNISWPLMPLEEKELKGNTESIRIFLRTLLNYLYISKDRQVWDVNYNSKIISPLLAIHLPFAIKEGWLDNNQMHYLHSSAVLSTYLCMPGAKDFTLSFIDFNLIHDEFNRIIVELSRLGEEQVSRLRPIAHFPLVAVDYLCQFDAIYRNMLCPNIRATLFSINALHRLLQKYPVCFLQLKEVEQILMSLPSLIPLIPAESFTEFRGILEGVAVKELSSEQLAHCKRSTIDLSLIEASKLEYLTMDALLNYASWPNWRPLSVDQLRVIGREKIEKVINMIITKLSINPSVPLKQSHMYQFVTWICVSLDDPKLWPRLFSVVSLLNREDGTVNL